MSIDPYPKQIVLGTRLFTRANVAAGGEPVPQSPATP